MECGAIRRMGSKLLQGVGVVAVVGLVAGSIIALGIVKQRIHVTIAAEEQASNRGPDPIELLRADVGVISADLAGLNKGLGEALQSLHDSLESAAGDRAAAFATRVTAMEARLDAMKGAAARDREMLQAAIAALGESLAESRLEAATAQENAVEAAPPKVVEKAAEIVAPTPAPEVALEVAPAAPAPTPSALPRKKGFLGFQLPSGAFAFDQRQRFAILPSLSRVGFDAKSTLHDFSGVTTKVDGKFSVNLAMAGEKPLGTITVETKSLDSGLADRDVDMRKYLGAEQFGSLTFEWSGFSATSVDAKAMTVAGNATGTLTIRGKSQKVSMPVKVSVDASKRVAIDGELSIKMSDYDVAPPSQLGLIKVEDEVKIWVALRARLVGPAKEGE